jgi:hypothetical protein
MNPYHRHTVISSSTFLVLNNLIIITIAFLARWSLLTLLWGYWLQSLIIGLFTALKILMFGHHRIPRYTHVRELHDTLLFICHYGGFHLVYLIFLYWYSTSRASTLLFTPPDLGGIALIGVLFFLTHLYSFAQHYLWEQKIVIFSSQQLFLDPYKRIFPMHLTIIAAGFFSTLVPPAEHLLLVMFLILKTFADLKSHEILHQSDTYPTFHHL